MAPISDVTGAEVDIGWRFNAGNVHLTPAAGGFVYQRGNDRYQIYDQINGSRCRDTVAIRVTKDISTAMGTGLGAVTPTRMMVDLDAGRSVAFDLKDYAHVDHGYAATLHKSQGVTVDCTHVLATPGLDRHATYVALSR